MAASRSRGAGRRFLDRAAHPAVDADRLRRLAFRLEPWEADDAWRHSLVVLKRAGTAAEVAEVAEIRAVLLDVIEAADPAAFAVWMPKALGCGAHRGPSPLS